MSNPTTNNDFKIATFAAGVAGLVTLQSLGIPNPFPAYRPGATTVKLGDNSARTLGSPNVVWQWGFLTAAQRDTLRTYCTGASADVFIVSPTTEKISSVSNAAQTFQAKMIWPAPDAPEMPQAGRRLEVAIMFRQLVVQ